MAPIQQTEENLPEQLPPSSSILDNNGHPEPLVFPPLPKSLTGRSDTSNTYEPGTGTVNPDKIHMGGLMALFALIGAAFVLAAIWFFFWARNGGFVWRKGDWEEYKSTVLRRKGPDGRTLSNATKSTDLGGGSVVGKGYSDYDGRLTFSESARDNEDAETAMMSEKNTTKGSKRKRGFREKLLRRRREEVLEEAWEGGGEGDEDVRAYRNEKAARVGGLNGEPDGTYHGSDYDTSYYNRSEMSEVRDYAYDQPSTTGKELQPRRDFSFIPGSEDIASQHPTETHRLHEPSSPSSPRQNNRRRDRERQRHSARERDGDRESSPRKQQRDRRSAHGHYSEPLDFSSNSSRSGYQYQYSSVDEVDYGTGTKSYHHPIPGLTKGYRRDGGGGRRKRRDSLSDSDGDDTRIS